VDMEVRDFVEGLVQVLEPLLPGSCYGWDERRGKWGLREGEEAERVMGEIREGLEEIVRKCVALHLAIRWRGGDGTVVRVMLPEKGKELVEGMPFVCRNEEMMEESRTEGKVKRIMMACWGRVEAYVPHGRTYGELLEIEQTYRRMHGVEEGREVDWKDVDEWYEAYHGEHVNPMPPRYVREKAVRDGVLPREGVEEWRAPFVTTLNHLCKHEVYCEWDEPANAREFDFNEAPNTPTSPRDRIRQRAMAEKYGKPIPRDQRVSLQQAVKQARKERHCIKHKLEDTAIDTWRHVNRHWFRYESLGLSLGMVAVGFMLLRHKGINLRELATLSQTKLRALLRTVIKSGKGGRDLARELYEAFAQSTKEKLAHANKMASDLMESFHLKQHVTNAIKSSWNSRASRMMKTGGNSTHA
jgi:hypothetical protein